MTHDFEIGERQGAPAQAGSAAEDVNVAADEGRRGNNEVELKSQKKEGEVQSESARRECLIV